MHMSDGYYVLKYRVHIKEVTRQSAGTLENNLVKRPDVDAIPLILLVFKILKFYYYVICISIVTKIRNHFNLDGPI